MVITAAIAVGKVDYRLEKYGRLFAIRRLRRDHKLKVNIFSMSEMTRITFFANRRNPDGITATYRSILPFLN